MNVDSDQLESRLSEVETGAARAAERLELLGNQLHAVRSALATAGDAASASSGIASWSRSTIIALLALLFSLVTAGASAYITWQQDRSDTRREVLTIIQRLGDLSRQARLLPPPAQGIIAQELAVLGGQAAAIASRRPDLLLPVEFSFIAKSLAGAGWFPQALAITKLAPRSPSSALDRIDLARAQGLFEARLGHFDKGRKAMQTSLAAIDSEAALGEEQKKIERIMTRLARFRIEIDAGDMREGETQLSEARNLVASLSDNTACGTFREQLKESYLEAANRSLRDGRRSTHSKTPDQRRLALREAQQFASEGANVDGKLKCDRTEKGVLLDTADSYMDLVEECIGSSACMPLTDDLDSAASALAALRALELGEEAKKELARAQQRLATLKSTTLRSGPGS